MLSLPERGDRRTPLLAAANATNLTLTVLDAIRDRQIPQSDWPQVCHFRGVVVLSLLIGMLVVGNKQLGAEGRGTRLPHVSREDLEKVSGCTEPAAQAEQV